MTATTLTKKQRQIFEVELARIKPLLAQASRCAQERLLDEAFEHAGIKPAWEQWYAWARVILPAHRAGETASSENNGNVRAHRAVPAETRRAG